MRRKCLNLACTEFFTPDKEHRPFNGCCSASCRDVVARGFQGGTPVALTVRGHEIPTSERVYHRKVGGQNWKPTSNA